MFDRKQFYLVVIHQHISKDLQDHIDRHERNLLHSNYTMQSLEAKIKKKRTCKNGKKNVWKNRKNFNLMEFPLAKLCLMLTGSGMRGTMAIAFEVEPIPRQCGWMWKSKLFSKISFNFMWNYRMQNIV